MTIRREQAVLRYHERRSHHYRGGVDADMAKASCKQNDYRDCRNIVDGVLDALATTDTAPVVTEERAENRRAALAQQALLGPIVGPDMGTERLRVIRLVKEALTADSARVTIDYHRAMLAVERVEAALAAEPSPDMGTEREWECGRCGPGDMEWRGRTLYCKNCREAKAIRPDTAPVVAEERDMRVCRLHGLPQDDPNHDYTYPDCENAGYAPEPMSSEVANNETALRHARSSIRNIITALRSELPLARRFAADILETEVLPAISDSPTGTAGIDVERLARALNATVGSQGWVRLTPSSPVEEWRMNALLVAAEYDRLAVRDDEEPRT